MSKLDIALIALVVLPAILGLFKGLVNLAITLAGVWAAFVLAAVFSDDVLELMSPWLGEGPLASAVAYGLVFLVVVLLAGLVAWLVTRSFKALDLQWANRLGGAAVGLACGVLLASVLVAAWQRVAPESGALAESALARPIGAVTSLVVALPAASWAADGAAGDEADGSPAARPDGEASTEVPPELGTGP